MTATSCPPVLCVGLLLGLFATSCAELAGAPGWTARIATVTVAEVEPPEAPVAAQQLFGNLAKEMLLTRGYEVPGEEPDARLRIRLEDWQSRPDGSVRLRARVSLAEPAGELWAASGEATGEPVPGNLRGTTELPVRRPVWEVAVERVLQMTLQRLPRRPRAAAESESEVSR